MAGFEHHAYTFDSNKLGIRTRATVSGPLSASWQAGTLDNLAHLTLENWNVSQWHTQARGFAIGADSVSVWLDDAPLPVLYDNASTNGLWQAEMSFTNGSHVVRATAYHPLSRWSTNATNVFIAVGLTNITSGYDAVGNVTNRTFSNGRVQALFWDASGRLMQVSQRDAQTNGFDWTAVYDALGRRLQTVNTPVSNNVALASTTIDSWFDPQVEFLEIGVAVNGVRTWKVNGPDLNGGYGASQGVGGLEATVRESDGYVTPVLNDSFGNVVATIYGGQVVWAYPKLVGYGPVAGYSTPVLSTNVTLADATLWRTRRMDPTGFFWLGARYYVEGRFLSADPLGHDGSLDLYAFANGDPVNYFDADGRWGKQLINGIAKVGEYLISKIIGADFGSAWLNPQKASRDVSYDEVPKALAGVNGAGLDPQINDNKYGHSTQMSALQNKFGLVGTPLITVGGIGYELYHLFVPGHVQGTSAEYSRPAPFFGLFDGQHPVNWLYDTPGDLLGNTIGQLTSIFSLNYLQANKITFMVPGPNYSQERFNNLGKPEGFWTTLAPPGVLNPWNKP